MSGELNPNWFEVTIPRNQFLNFEDWKNQRNSYFEILRSKISPIIEELKAQDLISSWHILTHGGLDLRLLLRHQEDLPKVTKLLGKYRIESELRNWKREKGKSGEDRVLELLSEATLQLKENKDLVNFLLREGPIHYLSNQLGLGNFGEAELYLLLSLSWFGEYFSRAGQPNKVELVEKAFKDLIKDYPRNT